MASDAGPPPDPLTRGPDEELLTLDFFQVLRRIECAHRDLPRLGEANRSADEPVRLGQDPSLSFQGRPLVSVKRGEEDKPLRLSVAFFGAFGPNGPLPLHLTEYAQQRARNANDPTFARFVDLFHHRLLLLFYRAWANAQPVVSHDRPDDDAFAFYVGALSGHANRPDARRDDNLDSSALYMAGMFASQTRNAEGLVRLLAHHFRVKVDLEEFVGEWLDIPDAYTFRLGREDAFEGAGRLGLGTRLGRRTFERQSKFRIVLGPLTRAEYDRFMPGGDFLAPLVQLVERYAGHELGWDLRLILEVPARTPTRLDGKSALGRSSHLVRLGASVTAPFQDFVFSPFEHARTRGSHG